ncbi:Ras GTP-binding protein A [Paragonimus heterotremus]|uniref:Ras GTP-binding protein A n=1 Tax=Paragonimus heterotremus TaxID=100268 RepID=A0A8J4T118_9TREM|nr:Ras GTP-binding protein A [Paragonimus heterotremus]
MRKKVLLMGKSGSGKTSMRSIIFANYIARDTLRLGPTMDVEHTHMRILSGLVLNLWDCGGQDGFMESYFVNQRETIFRNVEVLIYVFDIDNQEVTKDLSYYRSCVEAVNQNSPGAKIFCLIHKTDLVNKSQLSDELPMFPALSCTFQLDFLVVPRVSKRTGHVPLSSSSRNP